jgi:threonine aldolase
MLQSMVSAATFADDIYGRDPTTILLETRVANMSGFEDAVTLSGTQIRLRTHLTQPPRSILCDERTDVYAPEVGRIRLKLKFNGHVE